MKERLCTVSPERKVIQCCGAAANWFWGVAVLWSGKGEKGLRLEAGGRRQNVKVQNSKSL